MTPLPMSFPSDAFSILISKLRGQPVATVAAVTAVWNVLGYAAGQVVPTQVSTDPPAVPDGSLTLTAKEGEKKDEAKKEAVKAPEPPKMSNEALANSLQAYADSNDGKQAVMAALPWSVLLPALISLAKSLFEQYLAGK